MTTVDAARDDRTMTFVAHLTELRRRLIVCAVALFVGAVIAYIASPVLIRFLVEFYRDATDGQRDALIFTGPLDAFTTRLKIATYGGFVLALPIFLWQIWRFVTPGLNDRERRYVVPFVLAALVMFAFGGALALITLPQALEFLLGVGGSELEPLLTADRYLSLVALMVVAFGVSFQFPVLLTFLLLAGVISTAKLRSARRYVAVGVVAFAAVITPSQDPISLLAMAIPLYFFYEVCILIGRMLHR